MQRLWGGSRPTGAADASKVSVTILLPINRSAILRGMKSGRIVGHLGLCRTYFEGQGIGSSSGRVATMHIIDWLGSPEQRSIGISLMRLSHQGVQTQFGLGVSPSALAVGERAGYELRGLVPVYNRVLRARLLATFRYYRCGGALDAAWPRSGESFHKTFCSRLERSWFSNA